MTEDQRGTKVSGLGVLEALLFAAEEPLSAGELAELVELTPVAVRDQLEELRLLYEQGDGALQLIEIAKGFRLATKPQYAPYVRALKKPRAQRLSRAGLESLAIIAYRQPVTGPEIDNVRGVDSSGVVQTLLERGLIEVAGRKEGPGRPRMYRTSQSFLDQFGLADLSELPELPEGDLTEMAGSLFADGKLTEVTPEDIARQLAEERASAAAEAEAAATSPGQGDQYERPEDSGDPPSPVESTTPEPGETPGEPPAQAVAPNEAPGQDPGNEPTPSPVVGADDPETSGDPLTEPGKGQGHPDVPDEAETPSEEPAAPAGTRPPEDEFID